MSRKGGEDWVLRQHLERIKNGTAEEPAAPDDLEYQHPAQQNISDGFDRITGRISELSEHVQALVSTWRVQEERAVDGRRVLREQMDELAEKVKTETREVRADVATLRRQVEPLIERVTTMQARVDDYWDNKQRMAGGWKALTIVGAIATGLVGAIVAVAKMVAAWLNGGPHHL